MPETSGREWADVVFTQPPAGKFTYAVPESFRETVQPGHRVMVRLGNRKMAGFLVEFVPEPDLENVREIEDVLDPEPLLSPELLDLTRWIASYYMSTWGEAVRAALPPGVMRHARLMIEPLPESSPAVELDDTARRILACIQERGAVSFQALTRSAPLPVSRFLIATLEKAGLVRVSHILEEQQASVMTEKWIALDDSLSKAEQRELVKNAPRQAAVLERVRKAGEDLRRSELEVPLALLRQLESKGLINIYEQEVDRTPYRDHDVPEAAPLTLSEDQQRVFGTISAGLQSGRFGVYLIHGVTASGKTQVYIEAVRETLKQGRTALILIPEISLTPQAVQRYRSAFGDQVAILHSRMSMGERFDSWRMIKEGQYRIALGPRSAVFAPLPDLGLIVIDEEHDGSYKQSDPAPRYHARDTAVMRAHLNNATVILGSATPSLESYHNAVSGKYTLCELQRRIDETEMPLVTLVDLNEEEEIPSGRVLSEILIQRIGERLDQGEQVMLLQNRRGYSTLLQCRECGAVAKCRDCDISLTFHQYDNVLKCHYCGYRQRADGRCRECGGETIKFQGAGTQRVQEALNTIFPDARILRMDQDSTGRKGAHDRIIRAFEAGKADILLGTQMIAKGHDFSAVNLVGIISADTGIHFPDFRAGERTFQLLTQTAGRAGRRDRRGEVVIQTRVIDHPVITLARTHDFIAFYKREMAQRRELVYPPWGRMALIRLKGGNEAAVQKAAATLRERLPGAPGMTILGPVPCPIARIKQLFRYQIILRIAREADPAGNLLRKVISRGMADVRVRSLPPGVRIAVDIDPTDTL
ncbi:primosomal protein N' [bacterium]|nr:primosomal protein N' [bacterium]